MQISLGYYRTIVLAMMIMIMTTNGVENHIREVGVGVILDMDSSVGKSIRVCIKMALEDFYGAHHNNFTTIIHPHFRDSKYNNFQAASVAIDLLKDTQVIALLGPQQSSQAHFIIDIANFSEVPIISPATSPDLSPIQNPYFIRIAQTSSTQVEPIAALIKSFGWREVVFVYEDTDFGREPISYLFDAMVNIGTQVKHCTLLSPSSSIDSILQQLHKLKTMQTRVFVVHMLPTLASRFFKKANEMGMMAPGYVWIITDVLTGLLHDLDPQDFDSMQGVLGIKPYIPPSNELTNFKKKWRRKFMNEYPETDTFELDMFGIRSYASVFALATALQRVETNLSTTFKRPKKASTDLDAIGTSEIGSMILPMIQNIRRKGLSGDFHVINGQLQTPNYQIVNVLGNGEKHIGFWNSKNGLSRRLSDKESLDYTTNKDDLGAIIWPGDTSNISKGRWENSDCNDTQLRIGIPADGKFVDFIEAKIDPITQKLYTSGFCIDVLFAIIDAMPFCVNYTLIPFENPDGERSGNYDDFVNQIPLGKYDIAAGDLTILYERSKIVDFTLSYMDSGVSMLVPVKVDNRTNMWIFLAPLEMKLWITIGAFFIYTGFVVWVLEHRTNKEFRGPPRQQVGTIFWFSFSTLVFAHKEKIANNLSRFVVIVWVCVVLVLTSNYTASLASMLTVQQLVPKVTNVTDLIKGGAQVGYQDGSFVENMLKNMSFSSDKLKKYPSFEDYDKALSNGSISAIFDEVPYLKMFQSKYCNKYTMVGPIYKYAGFGYAFPKESPLVVEFSRAILKVVEGPMRNISNKWFGNEDDCLEENRQVQPFAKLTLDSFKGLFLIAGLSSTYALVVYTVTFLYENKNILVSQSSVHEKITAILRSFDEEKDNKSFETQTIIDDHISVEENMMRSRPPSPTISVKHEGKELSSPSESVSES